ncbi:MAG: TIGR00266 family protein [Synechococcaceae cyanobacterium RL_1_2]|nr:TIGR00266 family protein [Synechococcaceae cyanobacterium RL_1_2]
MKYEVKYQPAFAAIFITLAPGDRIMVEAGAMTSMDGRITMKTEFSGGLFNGLIRKFLGGESLFVNIFANHTQDPLNLTLTQSLVGDIASIELGGNGLCFQHGAYIASTPGVKLGVKWAGFTSWFAGEGLFKLEVRGKGLVFFGSYGGITKREITKELIVDNSHLLAYSPNLKMSVGLSGGLISSMTSGEGFVNRVQGRGVVYLQSRSVGGLVNFLRTKLR